MAGMGDILGLMKNAKEMMAKAKTAQAELAKNILEGSAGAGLVRVKVNGLGDVVGLEIERVAVNPDESEMLCSMILSAIADARKKAEGLRNSSLQQMAGGVDLSALGINL